MNSNSKKTVQKERFSMAIDGDKSAVKKLLQNKPKNKYKAIKKEYNGVMYASTKEADYAQRLDFLVKCKQIEKWERQITYKLAVEGILICKYILDFKVYYPDGHIEFIDVKGSKKGQAYQMFVIKKKLMQAIYDIDVLVA